MYIFFYYKGKKIRTWRTDNGELIKEFTTGTIGIENKLICFNRQTTLLVAVQKADNNRNILSWDLSTSISQSLINEISKYSN